jgi:hypothetical protein
LLLLLSEVMASKHVPLNQTPEYDSHRTNTMTAANTVFNLMTLGSPQRKTFLYLIVSHDILAGLFPLVFLLIKGEQI